MGSIVLQGRKGSIGFADSAKPMVKKTNTEINCKSSWQRRMGVEPTGDRAERPPSRFEDGETHRGPYTSICVAVFCHSPLLLSSSYCFFNQVLGCALHLPRSGSSPSTLPRVNQGDHDHQQLLCNACLQRALPAPRQRHLQSPRTLMGAYVAPQPP